MRSMQCEDIVDRWPMIMKIRTYTELSKLHTFEDRYRYLRLRGSVGEATFGFDRLVNQFFYQRSKLWNEVRNYVITRDNGCDLGIRGHEISKYDKIFVHHMNPITLEDIENESDFLIDPEYLITTIHNTHNAIHYGDEDLLIIRPIERTKNDTCPWRQN
jgi:hypothetical protein